MRKKPNNNPYTVEQLLGEDFVRRERRSIGALDSAHETAMGVYKGQEVVAKPFYSKSALHTATKEADLEREIKSEGVRTVEPIEVVRPQQPKTAVLVTKYISGLISATTLTLEADPQSEKGLALAKPMGGIAVALGGLHGIRVTHGDPQPKNFGFLTEDVSQGIDDDPLIFDFEGGARHGTKRNGPQFFENAAKNDLGTLSHVLGFRRFGGAEHEPASEVLREVVIRPYAENSSAGEALTSQGIAKAIDYAVAEFMRGRSFANAHAAYSEKRRAEVA